jgi:hypothetical protein
MSQITLDAHDAREVEAMMARATDICAAIEWELAKRWAGRPREWTVKGMLTAFVLIARHEEGFFIDRGADLIATLPTHTRERLELNRLGGRPFTNRQISYAWNEISRCIDPAAPGIDDTERERRLELLIRVQNELLYASVDREYRRHWTGDTALDATLVWAHGRPPQSANNKTYAGAADGDGIRTSKRAELLDDDIEVVYEEPTSDHPFLHDLRPAPFAKPEYHEHSGRRRRRDRGNKAVCAKWIGGNSISKVLFGYAHHIAIAVGGLDSNDQLPPLAVGHVTTASTSHPARSVIGMLTDINDRLRRSDTGGPSGLGDVLADGGYSGAKPEHWGLPIRQLGAEPVFQLHTTNQLGHRGTLEGHAGGYLLVDGRYYCPCLPEQLHHAPFPRFGKFKDRDHDEMRAEFRAVAEQRLPYELRPRGRYRDTGLRFSTPHGDVDCPSCGTDCCATNTVTITWDQLGLYQKERFGTEAWAQSYGRRSQVEGFFGMLKAPTVGRHNRNTSLFFEYAKTSLAATFHAIATNLYQLANWHADRAAGEPKKRHRPGRPSINPTLDDIAANPDVLAEARTEKRRARGRPGRAKPPPDSPFAHLGAPRS